MPKILIYSPLRPLISLSEKQLTILKQGFVLQQKLLLILCFLPGRKFKSTFVKLHIEWMKVEHSNLKNYWVKNFSIWLQNWLS